MRAQVRAFLGAPGSGKTYAMSVYAAAWRQRHPELPIYSTYELRLPGVYSLDPPGDTWGPLVSVLEAHHGLILIDEAALMFDARLFQKTPAQLLHRLMQYRKHGLELWWSTQFVEYVDKRLRLLTTESYHMSSFARFLVPGFLGTIRDGVSGQVSGVTWVMRTAWRDGLYDTSKAVGAAHYYEEGSKSSGGRRAAAAALPEAGR